MKYFIVCLICLLLVTCIYIIRKIISDKNIYDLLKKNEGKYRLIKAKKKSYDYVLRCENKDIYLCVLKIPKYSMVCINSKDTWKLSYNSVKQDKGRGYSNSRYLDEIKYFLLNDIKTEKTYLKVIMLYKTTEGIVRYLNESELDCIDINKTPYGYKITTYDSFEKDLDILLK